MPQYADYAKFFTPEDAQFLIALLQRHQIPYTLEHEVNQLDKVYIGQSIDPMFTLQIPVEYFKTVNALLASQAVTDMAQPGFEHLMQSYTAEELQEIINEPAGWSAYDLQVAAKLLSEKTHGSVVAPISEPAFTPLHLEGTWIGLGYLASVIGPLIFIPFGAASFIGGLATMQVKKTLKDGSRVKMYDEDSRKHGKNFMIITVVLVVLKIVLAILQSPYR